MPSNKAIATIVDSDWTIGKGPTKEPPSQGAHADIHQVLHQDVWGVLGPAGAGLQHAETCVHEHHQGTTKTHPGGVQSATQAVVRGLQGSNLQGRFI